MRGRRREHITANLLTKCERSFNGEPRRTLKLATILVRM
jgi:hypothetical protein